MVDYIKNLDRYATESATGQYPAMRPIKVERKQQQQQQKQGAGRGGLGLGEGTIEEEEGLGEPVATTTTTTKMMAPATTTTPLATPATMPLAAEGMGTPAPEEVRRTGARGSRRENAYVCYIKGL